MCMREDISDACSAGNLIRSRGEIVIKNFNYNVANCYKYDKQSQIYFN